MPPSLEDYRWRIANIVLGGTTLRNQGAPGVEKAARIFVTELDLHRFVTDDEATFQQELDLQTERLRLAFPVGAQNWGAARKAINLFLGEVYLHRVLCEAYDLKRIAKFLEVPLDSQVAQYLREKAYTSEHVFLPSWKSIKGLTPADSQKYQDFAVDLSESLGRDWVRIDLDVIIWRGRPSP